MMLGYIQLPCQTFYLTKICTFDALNNYSKIYKMGRNTEKNIKKHNDKLHKEQDKAKAKKVARAEKLKAIVRKFNEEKKEE